jgi:putative tricarboxylic transport membrane protein
MGKSVASLVTSAIGVAAALAGFPPLAAAGETWKPDKSVEIVVTCQPGCGPDIAARNIQKIWQDHGIVQAPAVVVNKPGGGGSVAYSYIQQKADGHAIVLSGAGAIVNTIMGRGLGHKDVTPVAMVNGEYVALAVRADSALRSGRELIEVLRKDPQAATFGIANSLGNANHQSVALALKQSGIHPARTRNVVFQSGGAAITALLGGHVQAVPASIGLWVGPLKSGQVRLLAVSSPERIKGEFSNVPTWREQGVDAVISVWRMIMGPPGLSPAQTAYWENVLRRTTRTPEWQRELERNYQSDEFMVGAELRQAIEALHAQLTELLTELELAKGKR